MLRRRIIHVPTRYRLLLLHFQITILLMYKHWIYFGNTYYDSIKTPQRCDTMDLSNKSRVVNSRIGEKVSGQSLSKMFQCCVWTCFGFLSNFFLKIWGRWRFFISRILFSIVHIALRSFAGHPFNFLSILPIFFPVNTPTFGAEPLSMLLIGQSFIRRLANYALVSETMNMGLEEGDC